MPNCVVKGCKNYDKKVKKKDGISYHRFPNDPVRREYWSRIVRIQRNEPYFKPYKNTRMCSSHFCDEDVQVSNAGLRRLKVSAVPKLGIEISENKVVQPSPSHNSILNTPDSPRKTKLKKRIVQLEKRQRIASKKIRNLLKQNARLKTKNESLQDIIKILKQKKYITEQMESALQQNVEIAEIYRLQIIKNKNKKTKTKPQSYPPALRKFAMALNFYSPSAYKFVRRKFNSCLPHPRTLTKWYSSNQGEPGFTKESFDMLKLKRESSSDNIECCLVFDEMNIRQAKIWKGERNIGYVDLGHGKVDKEKKATKAFVMMLVCLTENWKLPVGYFLVDGFTSELIANSINICLEKCNTVGVNVQALTFDGCPTNVKAANILGCNISSSGELKTTFPHPVTNINIVVFMDACHMIKLVRNVFEKKKIIFNEKGQRIEWKFLIRLLKLQTDQQLNFANKLTYRHIYFKNQIMKVKLAAQLLSRSVAKAITLCNEVLKSNFFSDSGATVEFIHFFNDIFDILNSRRFNQSGYKRAISPKNKAKIYKLIEEAIAYKKGLKIFCKVKRVIKRRNRQQRIVLIISKQRILESKSKVGFLGLIVCMESLKILYQNLVESSSKLKYISTYRLSQDHLELFFSLLRNHGGFNDNPNAIQLKGAYRRCMNHLSLKSTFTGNSIPLDNFPILNVSSVNAINFTSEISRHESIDHISTDTYQDDNNDVFSNNCAQLSVTLNNQTQSVFGHLTENISLIVGYIAGWVARSLMKKIKCEICVDSLVSSQKLYFHKLIELTNMCGLCFPSSDLFEVCLETEKKLRQSQRPKFMTKSDFMYFSTKILSTFVGKSTFDVLSLHSVDQPATFNHRLHLVRAIIQKYLNVRMHHESVTENTGMGTKRQKFKKLVLFKGQ